MNSIVGAHSYAKLSLLCADAEKSFSAPDGFPLESPWPVGESRGVGGALYERAGGRLHVGGERGSLL